MTTLSGTVTSATVGARGADMLSKLTQDNVQTLVANGYAFCVRYVPLADQSDPGGTWALTTDEAQAILDGGLALMVVQRARTGAVQASQGTDDGDAAVTSCQAIGLPRGVNVWLDLESISGEVLAYANNWYMQVLNAGYAPGVYVGAAITDHGQAVTGYQLYWKLLFQHYWRSMSDVPDIENRGYQMIQLRPGDQMLEGLQIDIDVTQEDYEGDWAQWLSPSAAPTQEVSASTARTRRVRT